MYYKSISRGFYSLVIYLIAAGVLEADAKTFIDPRLEAWSSVSTSGGKSNLAAEQREVIVYLKSPRFVNRSGLSLSAAISAEESDLQSYVTVEAHRLLNEAGVNKNPLTPYRPEVLWASQAFVVSVTRKQLNQISNDAAVDGVIENSIITMDEPIKEPKSKVKTDESKMTYGLQKINVQAAWNAGLTGENVVVGVIDTGVDKDHPDLKGKIILQKDFTTDNDNKDYNKHGTHVSGTIAGGSASGRAIGVAPGAKIIMAKVFNSKGQAQMAELLKAMEWFLDPDGNPDTNDAPRVVSNSWGSGSQFTYGFRNIVRQWRRFEIFPNFAAGNSGMFFTVGAPASYPFSYAIGAVDENHKVTSFSSRGPTILFQGWRPRLITKPEVSAPGYDVYSSVPGGKYERFSGTSMATPHVSGVIALILQKAPHLKIEDIEGILNSTALDRGSKGKDNRYGHGVVQVDKVVARLNQWEKENKWDNSQAVSSFQDKDPNQWEWDTP